MIAALLLTLAATLPLASSHASIWHPSMYGFNVTDKTFPYDNRPVSPLMTYTFDQWWFHGHLDYPPNPGDIFELPAGKPATTEIACNKGATTWFNSSEGGDIRQGDSPCPNSDPSAYHTTGFNDLKGCALAIAYKSDARQVQPEDFTVFSVNQTCVWTRFTDFQVPARMPPCPEGGCTCAWFWIHSPDSGGEQNYMTGFKCNVTGSTSNVPLAKPQLPRRCGADPDNNKPNAAPGNCTYGAKQPFYWFQKERNNMFEGTYSPPFYTDLYNFKDGAQDDIFVDSYPNGLPAPSPNSTFVPTPFLGNDVAQAPAESESASASYSYSDASSSAAAASASASVSASASAGAGYSSGGAVASSSSLSGARPPATSTPFSASTLSETASFSSSAISSSLSPELPLSTSSMSFPSASPSSGVAATSTASESETIATSTVVSTLVVTVTAGAPASSTSASAVSSSASGSVFASASSVLATAGLSSSAPVGSSAPLSSGGTAAPARSTIFLNGPSAAAPSPSAPASVSASPPPSAASEANGAGNAAPTTIDLNFAVDPNANPSDSVVRAAVRPGAVLAAAPTNAVCKRQFRRKVALRRRSGATGFPAELPSPGAEATRQGSEEPTTILSRINIPGLRRHRRLQERSSLWSFF